MTRFDRIPRDVPLCEEVVEDLCQGVQASMKGGRGSPVCRRLVNTPLDVLKRNVGGRPWTDRKAPRQIQGIVCDGVSRILAALEILLETVDGLANRVVHGPFSLERLARLDLCHGLGVLGPLGGLINLGVAQRQCDGVVPHQLLEHFQRGPSLEALRRKGTATGYGENSDG